MKMVMVCLIAQTRNLAKTTPKRLSKMKRHKLWDDRAHRLFQKTLESWSEKQITENTEVKQVQENSLLDMDDYNMLAKAVQGPAEKLLADGYTKEDLVDAFKASLGMDQSEIDSGGSSQEVYTRVDKLWRHVSKVDMDEDAREYIVDELLMILDKMDANVGDMNEEEIENPEVERAEDTARQAKIKALKAQLKALQKSM